MTGRRIEIRQLLTEAQERYWLPQVAIRPTTVAAARTLLAQLRDRFDRDTLKSWLAEYVAADGKRTKLAEVRR